MNRAAVYFPAIPALQAFNQSLSRDIRSDVFNPLDFQKI
jgi:hypothetical protein